MSSNPRHQLDGDVLQRGRMQQIFRYGFTEPDHR